ncbi:MAG: hypothetical protein ABSA92_06855 [Candidatus Bathyarchaeia archaeon]
MPKKTKVRCVGCGAIIRGQSTPMTLKITHSHRKLLESAKELGFTSSSWATGDVMKAPMHKKCFLFAIRVWKLAFITRALSPRRHHGEQPHPAI